MKVMMRLLAAIMIFGISLPACHGEGGGSSTKNNNHSDKGETQAMKTYYMGRFALDVPVEMKQAVQAQSLRGTEVKDFIWPVNDERGLARGQAWQSRIDSIKQIKLPRKIKKHVIEEEQFNIDGRWSKSILFYGNYIFDDEGEWNMLLDAGSSGLWLSYDGMLKGKREMIDWVSAIASKYQPIQAKVHNLPKGDWFYLLHGAINLPYKCQEKTYSRFEGHLLDLKLEVDMNETHQVEELGLAERLASSIVTRYAPGVDVDRIRSRSRTAAGLKGEELVSASGEDTQIQFTWEYRGEAESGERPEIQITMETPDGRLDEKLKIWDAILDSFKPMYR